MKNRYRSVALAACCVAGALMLSACESDKKDKPETKANAPVAKSSWTGKEGVAGSIKEDVVVIDSVVRGVDEANHRVTLENSEGKQFTFDVNPKLKSLSDLSPGDKVTATFTKRTYVGVRRDDAPPSDTYETTWGASGPGQMPGRLSAQETKKVGRVTAIDQATRMADIEFADGITKRVEVRPDVDLTRYKVGDNVVIRVTTALTILSKKS